MRFLVDNNLPPRFASSLCAAGHDAVQVCSLGPTGALDEEIFQAAAHDNRIIIAQETDFGTLLALYRSRRPSAILFRRGAKPIEVLVPFLLTNLPAVATELEVGAIVVFEDGRLRVRHLPIGQEAPRG